MVSNSLVGNDATLVGCISLVKVDATCPGYICNYFYQRTASNTLLASTFTNGRPATHILASTFTNGRPATHILASTFTNGRRVRITTTSTRASSIQSEAGDQVARSHRVS